MAAATDTLALAYDPLGRMRQTASASTKQYLYDGDIRYAQRYGTKRPCLVKLLSRRSSKIAMVGLANKTARMIWALMVSGEHYREPQIAAA